MDENEAKRKDIHKRMRISQYFLDLFILLCISCLLWVKWDSSMTKRKNRGLEEIAWQAAGDDTTYLKTEGTAGQDVQGKAEEGAYNTFSAGDKGEEGKGSLSFDEAEKETGPETGGQFLAGFDALLQINPDLKGWISIPGTGLSLPVVQGTDNSYYLNHDFYGKQDRHGTVFIDCGSTFGGGEKNTVIYGHNMRDGSMFGGLRKYRKEAYYKEHPVFCFYLEREEWEYEILAVLNNDILPEEGELFQYYNYKHIEDEEMFGEYYEEIKEHSFYDTGVEAQYGDELITLCTCDYGSADQRMLVVGKKRQPQ